MNARAGTVLIADDEPQNIELLTRLMVSQGYDVVSATDGGLALDALTTARPDILLIDVNMPSVDGFEVCRTVKSDPKTCLTPVILVTGLSESKDRVKGLEAGADDFVSKPFVVAELVARVRSLMRVKRRTDELDSAESIILSLALTIEARDHYTGGHCERLAKFAASLGHHLGLADAECASLYRGGFLHDVGKIGIPDAVLLKPGRLTSSEHELMQRHPLIGDTLCSEFRSLEDVRAMVRHHHERLDGTGYPDRLSGDQIPLVAQIISVVDSYDAMTTARPYRSALSPEHAFRELRAEAQKGWKSAALVERFASMLHQR
jgi:putative two-component system response regulator